MLTNCAGSHCTAIAADKDTSVARTKAGRTAGAERVALFFPYPHANNVPVSICRHCPTSRITVLNPVDVCPEKEPNAISLRSMCIFQLCFFAVTATFVLPRNLIATDCLLRPIFRRNIFRSLPRVIKSIKESVFARRGISTKNPQAFALNIPKWCFSVTKSSRGYKAETHLTLSHLNSEI